MQVKIKKTASRNFRRTDRSTQTRLATAVTKLLANPADATLDISKLRGRDGYRMRVGDWRVIYTIDVDELEIVAIGPRGKVY